MSEQELYENYRNKSTEALQPILDHLDGLIHNCSEEIEMKIKWSAPAYMYKGKSVCSYMAYKKHLNLYFQKGKFFQNDAPLLVDIGANSDMAGIKNISQIEDLPDDKVLKNYIKLAMKYQDEH